MAAESDRRRLRTPVCDLLGIEVPIVQAPIGPLVGPELVAAVSNAGGLGMLSGLAVAEDRLGELIDRTRELTEAPFGVNFILARSRDRAIRIALEHGVPVVSLFWGEPDEHVPAIHEAGALVMHTVGSPEQARRAVAAGVDIIVAQGWEAGGHVWDGVATMALIPSVVDAVAPVPVIAAGGIADGRGLAAVLVLGAQAAWLGTRFVATDESRAHPRYKRAVLEAGVDATIHQRDLFDIGWEDAPHRVLRNSTVAAWEEAGSPAKGGRPGQGETVARTADGREVPRYSAALPVAGMEGDVEAMALYAGQSAGLVGEIRPAAAVIDALASEAAACLTRFAATP